MKLAKRIIPIILFIIASLLISSCSGNDLSNTPAHRLQWWLEDINWDNDRLNYTGKGIRIAILDSGVDVTHPDLEHCIEKELKVSNCLQTNTNDNVLHGTAVAGVIASYPSNDRGILGIAPNSQIVSIDVTDDENGKVDVNSLIEGIKLAIDEKVDIISISVGMLIDNDSLHNVIKDAYNNNIIIIASAGNFTESEVLYPASYEEVICVGSKSKAGDILFPKNYTKSNIVYLPGENIVTTLPNGEYGATFGTSVSTPILTGTIALMLEANPKIDFQDVYNYFSNSKLDNIDVHKCIKMK